MQAGQLLILNETIHESNLSPTTSIPKEYKGLFCSLDEIKEIEDFLAGIGTGLGSYKKQFVDNDINMDALKSIYEENGEDGIREALKESGITSFGHQHKIKEAVLKLPG